MSKAGRFSEALRKAIDRVALGDFVEDASEQAPTDDGAEVLLVFVDGGRLLVTIVELGAEQPEAPESTPVRCP